MKLNTNNGYPIENGLWNWEHPKEKCGIYEFPISRALESLKVDILRSYLDWQWWRTLWQRFPRGENISLCYAFPSYSEEKKWFLHKYLDNIKMKWTSSFFAYNDPLLIGGLLYILQLASNVNGEAFEGTSHPFSDPQA